MSGEKDLEQLKREAAEKAKAAAAARRKAKEQQGESPVPPKTAVEPVQTEEDDLAKKKAAAVAKAKAAALAKKNAMEQGEAAIEAPATTEPVVAEDDDMAKKKAAAVAKAKAAAAAKRKAMGQSEVATEAPAAMDDELAKKKAAAVAKAKAAAAAKAKAAGLAEEGESAATGDDEKAKAIAAAKAKAKAAAAAKAKAAAGGKAEASAPVEEDNPSVNQPYLDKYVKVIEEHLGKGVLEDFYINKLSKDVPTLVAKKETYFKIAEFLKYNEQLGFDYLSELHGGDYETHMEVYAHLFSYKNSQSVALKVKLDRNEPTIESVCSLWAGANWPECEAYDLVGINFSNHPNLHRIMLGEEWVGHPLRKDYEPYDVEV